MEPNEKKMIFILILILIIVLTIFFITRNNKGKTADNISMEQGTQAQEKGSHSDMLSDGTRINNSEKIAETKYVDDIEISDIQLTEKDNVTELIANITNTSDKNEDGFLITITLFDDKQNEIGKFNDVFVHALKGKESSNLSTSGLFGNDYVDAYELTITKK